MTRYPRPRATPRPPERGAGRVLTGVLAVLAAASLATGCSTSTPAPPAAAAAPSAPAPPAGVYDVATVEQCLRDAGATISDGPTDVNFALEDGSRGVFQASFAPKQEIDVAVGADEAEVAQLVGRIRQLGGGDSYIFTSHNVVADVSQPDEPDGKPLMARCVP